MKLYTVACWDGEKGVYAQINDIADDIEAAVCAHRLAEDHDEVAIWRGEVLIQRVFSTSSHYLH